MRYISSFVAGVMTASTVFMGFMLYAVTLAHNKDEVKATPTTNKSRVSYNDIYDKKERA